LAGLCVFISEKGLGACHVPVAYREFDNAMDEAIDIAMDYLERTGQAVNFTEVQRVAAMAIVAAWKASGRHRSHQSSGTQSGTLFECQAIPETQLTSLGADNDEISRHRIYGRPRRRAALVEMVRVADVVITGQAYSKVAAVVEAETAIDRALAQKKVRLVPSNGETP
jgi:hypothetical protein